MLRVPPQEGLLLQQLSFSCLPIFKSLYMLHCSLALGALIGGGLNQGHMTNPFPFLASELLSECMLYGRKLEA